MPSVTTNSLIISEKNQADPLLSIFNRYRPTLSENDSRERITLVFHHCLALHKETWQPTIEHLFYLQNNRKDSRVVISEVWAMDAPNHGQTAALNDKHLSQSSYLSGHRFARHVQQFLHLELFKTKKTIVIGHSAGNTGMILSTLGYEKHNLPYSSIVLIEPPWMTSGLLATISKFPQQLAKAIESTQKGKDMWASREEARNWMKAREPYRRWDPQVLDLFVQYGLRDLPSARYPEKTGGITLACTREHEVSVYRAPPTDHLGPLARLSELCSILPVHCVYGTEVDFLSDEIRRGICDKNQGRQMASVVEIEGAGHLVAQEKPQELAQVLWKIINSPDMPGKL